MLKLNQFIGKNQLTTINQLSRGEEGKFFRDKLKEIKTVIDSMPKTYETDGQGNEAIIHLHYFSGGSDWYITERDMGDEQIQAFGLADMGYPELGYISISELIKLNVELDFYWKPKTLGEIRSEKIS